MIYFHLKYFIRITYAIVSKHVESILFCKIHFLSWLTSFRIQKKSIKHQN